MARRHYLFALLALLLIPVILFLGAHIAFAIDPEIAAGRPNYARNFRLLTLAKEVVLLGTFTLACGLWALCCLFVLKAKARSRWWLPLAIFGPFGLAALAMLEDRSPDRAPRRWVGAKAALVRVVFEVVFFVVVWFVAGQAIWLWSDVSIRWESVRTGVPVATIVDVRNASGGMWAFGEGLEMLFLVALLYLLRPVCLIAVKLFRREAVLSGQP
jgi:hypothetical protein